MNKLIASLIVSASLAGLVMADTGAANDDVSCEQVLSCIGDVVLVRPVGAAVTVANFGIFAVASPFAAMADATDEVFNTLVTEPGEYTFKRDLGDFSK
jgi:hypothetical protein